jgi:prevent-host-death family protein
MPKNMLTVTEVNQDFARAQRAVAKGPLIITNRGEPSLVLMTYKAYRAQKQMEPSLLKRLHVPGAEDIEVDFPVLANGSTRPATFD